MIAPAARRAPPGTTVAVAAPMLEVCRMASLQHGGPRQRRLGVTSAIRSEGRTSIAIAMSVIQSSDYGRRTLLLDLDLDRSHLAAAVGVAPWPGLCELVRGEASMDDVLQPAAPGLWVIAAGSPAGRSARVMSEFLGSALLAALDARFEVIVGDLPPVLASPFGAAAAAAFADLLLVIRAGTTPLARLREAAASLPVDPCVLLNDAHTALPRWLRRLAGI